MSNSDIRLISLLVVCLTLALRDVEGHGHLVNPPSRSSMWQEGFKTPKNYNLNQLNCGGFFNHWIYNQGKCGVCGDPYQSPQPRDNESGGKYGKGIITRTWQSGQTVTIQVLITANHMGWFEFRLCPDGSPSVPVTQDCLDRYLLPLADGSGTRYFLGAQERSVNVDVMLPQGLTCTQCVFQWKWRAGNNYGQNDDGTSCKGCGAQEEFYGCSDVSITSPGGVQNPGVAQAQTTQARTQSTSNRPFVTFPRITFPTPTNVVRTIAPNHHPSPTNGPASLPSFTLATQVPASVSAPNNPVAKTLPTGFLPISIDPTFMIRTSPRPLVTRPSFIRTTSSPASPGTTSRLQLITRPHTNPQTQTTVRTPLVWTYNPFTLLNPAGRVTTHPPTNVLQTTSRPLFTTKPPATPFYRPPTTRHPVVFTRGTPPSTTTFYRPPTSQPTSSTTTTSTTTTHTTPSTTQAPPPYTSPSLHCYAINSWAGIDYLESYCIDQCSRIGGACPPAFCECV